MQPPDGPAGRVLGHSHPVWPGDRILLGQNGFLQLGFQDGGLLKLGPGAGMTIRETASGRIQLHLLSGALELRAGASTSYEISTEATYLDPDGTGRYYLSRESGIDTVRVFEGRARVVHDGRVRNLLPGEGLFSGGFRSGWWSGTRLTRWSPDGGKGTVPRGSPGRGGFRPYAAAVELDLYGEWGDLALHGRVWWPHVPGGWTPYSNGRWIEGGRGRGRVWVTRDPWGWLPYGYGEWIFVPRASRWCWVPGRTAGGWDRRHRRGGGITVSADPRGPGGRHRPPRGDVRGALREPHPSGFSSYGQGPPSRPPRVEHPADRRRGSVRSTRPVAPRVAPARRQGVRGPSARVGRTAARVASRIGSVARTRRR